MRLSPRARAVRWISRHVRRNHGEHCHRCGWPVAWGCPTWWTARDAFWDQVEGSSVGIRCVRCFTLDCREQGVTVRWFVEPLTAPAQMGGDDA